MKFAFPQWKGFEFAPDGHLLDQLVDLSGAMGIACERSVGFYKRLHTHDRPMVVLPRGACRVRVRIGRARSQTYDVGYRSAIFVPAGLEHEDESLTSIFDTVALYPSPAFLGRVAADETITPAQLRRVIGRCHTVTRSRWLEQLLQEYVFARVVSRRESAQTLAFFERQILVELLGLSLGRKVTVDSSVAATADDGVTARALRYIEANLFSKVPVDAIARQAFVSPSTLLRQFRRDTRQSPHGYIKRRRLEEARRLIEGGAQAVGDVAMLVGYENFGSFSTAFRRQFGRPPTAFIARPSPRGADRR